jgi:hypothetical protein
MDPNDNSNQKSKILDSKLKEEDSKMKVEDECNESNRHVVSADTLVVAALHAFDQNRNYHSQNFFFESRE